jgi:pyruvate/2-oxoglutarate/acetoin dehydrogenase E1 component
MREITYIQALREALEEEMLRDEHVFLLGEDIGCYGSVFGATKGLLEKFGPMRVRQTPISECAIVGAACGAALLGLKPVAEIMYMDFITIGMDQLVNQAAKLSYVSNGQLKCPLVIRTPAGGGKGKGPHHSQCLEAWFLHVPGLKVVIPATPYDVKGLLKSSIRDQSPVLFIENSTLYWTKGDVPKEDYTVPIGVAAVRRQGKDVTILASSAMVLRSLEAAEALEKSGISAEVIDLRSLVPLDIDTVVESVKKTNKLLIVHEANKTGGIGAEIASQVTERAFDHLAVPVERLAGVGVPMPYAQSLEEEVIPSTAKIIAASQNLCRSTKV